MALELDYDGQIISSSKLDGADILEGRMKGDTDLEAYDILLSSMSDYLGTENNVLLENDNIAIVVNDRNRPTPTYLFFRYLKELFQGSFERISKIHVATGSHKEPSDIDVKDILGDVYPHLKDKVHIHKSREKDTHRFHGRTSRGTELYLDNELDGNDLIVFVNSVEPHYFAGFTGGRKSIIPGMAAYETIEQNHKYALDPGSRTLGLSGNPVHEDMEEAMNLFLNGRKHLSVQIVQGPGIELSSVHVGDVFMSFRDAVEKALENFCIPIFKRYDVVVSVARAPMDRTLYQAQKAIENGKLALKDGGTLILVASCTDGIGQSKFWDLLCTSDDPDEVLHRIDQGYKLGYHKAAKIVQLHKRARILLVSRMDPTMVEKGFIKGFNKLDDALGDIDDIEQDGTDILVIPDGTVTVPLVRDME